MTKDNKTTTTPPKSPATGTTGGAAPRKKLTLNTTAFQKKLSSLSVNNILEDEPDYEKMPSLAKTKRNREGISQNSNSSMINFEDFMNKLINQNL